jgi:hypothetical protein
MPTTVPNATILDVRGLGLDLRVQEQPAPLPPRAPPADELRTPGLLCSTRRQAASRDPSPAPPPAGEPRCLPLP